MASRVLVLFTIFMTNVAALATPEGFGHGFECKTRDRIGVERAVWIDIENFEITMAIGPNLEVIHSNREGQAPVQCGMKTQRKNCEFSVESILGKDDEGHQTNEVIGYSMNHDCYTSGGVSIPSLKLKARIKPKNLDTSYDGSFICGRMYETIHWLENCEVVP